jgi:hypothetical protein
MGLRMEQLSFTNKDLESKVFSMIQRITELESQNAVLRSDNRISVTKYSGRF